MRRMVRHAIGYFFLKKKYVNLYEIQICSYFVDDVLIPFHNCESILFIPQQ